MPKIDLEDLSIENDKKWSVVYTDKNVQAVVLNIDPAKTVPMEKHRGTQIITCVSGFGSVVVNSIKFLLDKRKTIFVPPETNHEIINSSDVRSLKLYTIYSPPVHSQVESED